ncbi:UNVERIFIED_CONTAM: hypothetical protein H355_002811, partial [Colinus virginianus]
MQEISQLIGLDPGALEQALCTRTVKVRDESVLTALSVSQGYYGRDALAKNIYSRLFDWLVNRINTSIQVKPGKKRKVMGVLDIYGFEIFQDNGFEQFIINYCNEKLQQIFILMTLKEEQEEYVREGIPWTPVEFFDNSIICDLIENSKVGILAMLDEECLRPGTVNEDTFIAKLNQVFASHKRYESKETLNAKHVTDTSLPLRCFRIHHYAGKCKKYREQLSPQQRAVLQAKLCASELFKDKKALYAQSLQQPFRGEYLGLTQNPKYQKLQAVAKDKLVMAEAVQKVNRANGKTVPRLLLLTTEHLVLADPKAAQPKTVLSLSDIRGASVSRFSDGLLALHLKETSTAGGKGDILLVSPHLIELVTRLHQTLMDVTAQALPLSIAD